MICASSIQMVNQTLHLSLSVNIHASSLSNFHSAGNTKSVSIVGYVTVSALVQAVNWLSCVDCSDVLRLFVCRGLKLLR